VGDREVGAGQSPCRNLTDGNQDRLSTVSLKAPLGYNRSIVTPGIVHLGVGAFCRSHIAVYVDDLLVTDPSWGIIGASLRKSDTRNALAPQDFLYTLVVRSGTSTTMRVIGSLLNVIDATTQRDELLAAMTDPSIRIVSLTVTEKGYCHDPATGEIDPRHPDIVHDVAYPETPVSAAGLIVRALELRWENEAAPFTVLCCDNLPANGETTARIITGFAALRDRSLTQRIASEVSFPTTMVDRIVPSTTMEDRQSVLEEMRLWDAWPVVTEPFTQWVIEDRFQLGRPRFESVGAQLVADVRPFELMKLRMLNGSHSTLAYLGYLAGYEFVSDAIADPAFHALISDLMTDEVVITLPKNVGDPYAYRDALLDRFANPALKHRTSQIAMDGSQKLPQRLLGTIRDRLASGLPATRASLGVAAWMRYVTGVDDRGRQIDVRDPLAKRLRAISDQAGGVAANLVSGLLEVREVFGEDLRQNEVFRAVLAGHLSSLFEKGALETVRDFGRRWTTG
jgi:fructuronate reductase